MNMDSMFRERARQQPDHPAILTADRTISYSELDAAIERAARELQLAGVDSRSCVGLHVPSGIEYIVLSFAAWRLDACIVPIPIECSDEEKAEICRNIAIDWILATGDLPEFARPLQLSAETQLKFGGTVFPIRRSREHPAGFTDIHAAFIRFTSGTTGTSKGVVLSHETIFERILAANDALAIRPDDRIVWVLSMSYHFTVSIVGYLILGATIILPSNHLADGILEAISDHRGTIFYASPVHYGLLAMGPRAQDDLSSLRLAISTAMSLDRDVASAFYRQWGIPISQALGIIEVGLAAINLDFPADRPEAVGRILPDYELRLEDAGFPSRAGEILLRGPGFLDAYYEPWRTRSEIMYDGWFHTGDLGELDDDQCLTIRGRSKDVINFMGMKLFPQEVERVLKSHPSVLDACVMGRPHDKLGELPIARVVRADAAEPTEEQLLDYCRSRIADFKVPTEIEFVENLPRTGSGKLLRRLDPISVPTVS